MTPCRHARPGEPNLCDAAASEPPVAAVVARDAGKSRFT
jgi:hypothetical protein